MEFRRVLFRSPCRNGWRCTGPARRGVGTRGRESSGSRGGPLGSIAVEEFAAAAVRAFSIEAITILAQPRLVARLAGEADGGVLAAGVAFEDRKNTRLNSRHSCATRMPSSD